GCYLGADRDDLDQSIGGSNGESGPWVEVGFRINAEGTGDGMYDRHLSQRVGHDHGDQSAEQIGNDHTRTRECDGYAAAKEEADSNGATDGNHRELARA